MKSSNLFRNLVVTVLIAFAFLTLFMSSSVLFDWFGIREKEGNYVPFIVWANFVAGFLYLISAYGIVTAKKWTVLILLSTAILLIIAGIALVFYISSGGIFEAKTLVAMVFRIALTIGFFAFAYYHLKKV